MQVLRKKFVSILAALVLLVPIIPFEITAQADDVVPTQVSYNDDRNEATIMFDLDKVDTKLNTITKITNNATGEVVYDENTKTDSVKTVVTQNGTYIFNVEYLEQQISEQVISQVLSKESTQTTSQTTTTPSFVAKEENITVTVDQLVTKQLENQPVKTKEFSQTEEKTSTTVTQENSDDSVGSSDVDQSVNLESHFYTSGYKGAYSSNVKYPITTDNYSIKGNTMVLGNPNDKGMDTQTLASTSDYLIDFRRPFEIEGKSDKDISPDGIAISFSRNAKYDSKNTGGSLGVYKENYDAGAKNQGLGNALVLELDTSNNYKGGGVTGSSPVYGDFANYQSYEYPHVAYSVTNSDGSINNDKPKVSTFVDKTQLDGSMNSFKISYDPDGSSTGTPIMKVTFGDTNREITYDFSDEAGKKIVESFQNPGSGQTPGAYITFSASALFYDKSTNTHYNNPITLQLDRIAYTDFEPKFETTVVPTVRQDSNYLLEGETATVTHKMWNTIDTDYNFDITSILSIEKLNVTKDDTVLTEEPNVVAGTVYTKVGNGEWEKYDGTFDKTHSLSGPVPSNSEPFYVKYEVQIPNNILQNSDSATFNWAYLAGEPGTTQYRFSGSLPIYASPDIFSQTSSDANKIREYDVLHSADIANIKTDIWKNIYGQSPKDAQPVALSGDKTDYTNFTISATYSKNLGSENSATIPDNLKKGDVVTLKITIKDKETTVENTFTRYLLTADNAVVDTPGTDTSGNKYYLSANNLNSLTETELVTKDADEYSEYVITDSKAFILKIDVNGIASQVASSGNLTVPDAGKNLDGSWGPNETGYDVTLNSNISGVSQMSVVLKQPITENTWSYNDEESSNGIDSGATGFILIPKTVYLDSEGKGSTSVEFSGYTQATVVRYKVTLPKTFQLTLKNQDTSKDSLTVETSIGNDDNVATDELTVGFIGSEDTATETTSKSVVNFAITSSLPKPLEKQIWNSNIDFNFYRQVKSDDGQWQDDV